MGRFLKIFLGFAMAIIFSATQMGGCKDKGGGGSSLTGSTQGGSNNDGSSVDDDVYENNDTSDTAVTLASDTYNYLKYLDDDWFTVYMFPGQTLNVTINFSHFNGDLDLASYDPNLGLVASSDSTTDNESASVSDTSFGIFDSRGSVGTKVEILTDAQPEDETGFTFTDITLAMTDGNITLLDKYINTILDEKKIKDTFSHMPQDIFNIDYSFKFTLIAMNQEDDIKYPLAMEIIDMPLIEAMDKNSMFNSSKEEDLSIFDNMLKEYTGQEKEKTQGERQIGLKSAVLIPAQANIKDVDPFLGVGVYSKGIADGKMNSIGLDVFFGSGKIAVGGIEEEFSDTLFVLSSNFNFLMGDSKGKTLKDSLAYFILGGGVAYEYAVIDTRVAGIKIEKDMSGVAFLLNVGLGYSGNKFDIEALYSFYPSSENMSQAILLSIGLRF